MLKTTKVEVEKISEVDIHLFIERGMTGGICLASKRYSKANNEFCQDYDETKKKFILNILTWIIYMENQWVNIYHMVV